MAKIIITGGAGFIGSNLAKKLVSQKQKVVVLDNLSTGNLDNLKEIKDKISFVKGDIRDLPLLKKVFKGADFVLHLAALPGAPISIKEPILVNDVNISGALNVLIASRDCKIKRVIFASSASVYGAADGISKESQMPQPLSPYAVSKITGEYYCRNFYELFGLPAVALRFFNVFGPNQSSTSDYATVIPLFIKMVLQGEQPIIFGDGGQSRDFIYVDNVAYAIIAAMKAPNAPGQAINIACGISTTINQLVRLISKILGKKITPLYQEPRPGDIYCSRADINKAREILGIKKQVSFQDGLKQTIAWYKKNV